MQKKRTDRLTMEALARSLQLPADCQRGRTIVSMEGRERVCIENFRGICSYTEQEIRLLTKRDQIRVGGCRLQIDCYTRDRIEISGYIGRVEYEEPGH